jgi:hypothetical protein
MSGNGTLSVETVLAWADHHRRRTGRWPDAASGPVEGYAPLTWRVIDNALRHGRRGLWPGWSLGRLLDRHRGKRNRAAVPTLDEATILSWADAHFTRTGSYPDSRSGPITVAPGETWRNVNGALHKGSAACPAATRWSSCCAAPAGAKRGR